MTFALITEGPSEHRVIKHIVSKYFKEFDPEINQIQPKIINNKQANDGGWNEVLKYCERDDLKEILIENDYLIIQIDTDQSQTTPFNISHTGKDNILKSSKDLCQEVIKKLTGLMKPVIMEKYSDKILFAICIHTIECWLLPLFFSNKHKSAVLNCLPLLNKELGRQNLTTIPNKDKNSPISIKAYEAILKNWKRKKDILESAQYNDGFQAFVDCLEAVIIQRQAEGAGETGEALDELK